MNKRVLVLLLALAVITVAFAGGVMWHNSVYVTPETGVMWRNSVAEPVELDMAVMWRNSVAEPVELDMAVMWRGTAPAC